MNITVALATFNGEKYLEEQLESILSQTLKPAAVVLSDDGSTDGTGRLLTRYHELGLIRLHTNAHRLGLVANFRQAVALAPPGHYIALSDQDDIWHPDKLEKCATLLQRVADDALPCLVHSDLRYIDEHGSLLNPSFRQELGQHRYRQNLETLVFGNFVNGCTTLFNPRLRQLLMDMPAQTALNHDGWMALLAFTFGHTGYLQEALVDYRRHSTNASIAEGTGPRNRWASVKAQVAKALGGQDDFLAAQFSTVKQFYGQYAGQMETAKRHVFERFLQLEHQSYFAKKLAFYRVVRRHPL